LGVVRLTAQTAGNPISGSPGRGRADSAELQERYSIFPRMTAEFEPQRAIMLSVSDLQPQHHHVLKQIAAKSAGHADLLILYNTDQQLKTVVELLSGDNSDSNEGVQHIRFLRMTLDTVWLRDFGPRFSDEPGGVRALDFYYYGVRPYDDNFTERWSLATTRRVTKIPWTLQGGNLIGNGQGLAITTTRIFDDNHISFGGGGFATTPDARQFLLTELKKFCNLQELVVLEPLRNESTFHVDMFAALLDVDLVLVARLNPRADFTNSQLLDRNARRLAEIQLDGKRMRVERIDIPPRQGESWSTYTNSIITDRLVLVPTMSSDPSEMVQRALATYRRLLPKHHVATVDISSMKDLQGSLHCMSLNIPAIAPLPEGVLSFVAGVEVAKRTPTAPPVSANSVAAPLPPPPYPIDEQLRRIFKSATGDYLVDAYAVAFDADVATLLRIDDKRLVRVQIKGVCEADRYWFQRNAEKIRSHGRQVQQMILNRAADL
jgi:agmatine/peptidylarginine deiminase